MKATSAEIERILSELDETPRRLTRASSRTDANRLRLKPDARGWSAVEVLSHLRSCADVWGASIEAMLAEDEPSLPDLHPRRWEKETDYRKMSFAASLKAFVGQRRKLLRLLRSLSFEEWERGANISGRRHTIFTQARRLAKHEIEHCAQVEELIA